LTIRKDDEVDGGGISVLIASGFDKEKANDF
jgi:hypothetical protein